MNTIGIDIGSSNLKVAVLSDGARAALTHKVIPSFSRRATSGRWCATRNTPRLDSAVSPPNAPTPSIARRFLRGCREQGMSVLSCNSEAGMVIGGSMAIVKSMEE